MLICLVKTWKLFVRLDFENAYPRMEEGDIVLDQAELIKLVILNKVFTFIEPA